MTPAVMTLATLDPETIVRLALVAFGVIALAVLIHLVRNAE